MTSFLENNPFVVIVLGLFVLLAITVVCNAVVKIAEYRTRMRVLADQRLDLKEKDQILTGYREQPAGKRKETGI